MSVQRLRLQTILWAIIFGVFVAPAQSVRIGKTQITGVETGNWPDFQLLLNIENMKDTPVSALKNWKINLNWGAQSCSVLNAENPETWLNQPSQVIMIVDNSTSMSGKTGFVEQAYKIFIDGVRKHTEVSIIRFQKPDESDAWGAEFIVQTSNSQYFMKDQNLFSSMTSRTFLFDATYQALSFIDNFIENGQKSVVVLSDGLDVGSSVSYSQLVQRATDMNIPLYFIDFSSRRDRNDKAKDLSSDTYGFYAASSNPKELTDIYFQILTQINNQVIFDAKYPVSGSAIPPNAELSISISDENGSVSAHREIAISADRVEALRFQNSLSEPQEIAAIAANAAADRGIYRDDNWFNLGVAAIRESNWDAAETAINALKNSGDVFAAERAKLLNIERAEAQNDPQLNTLYADYYRDHKQGIFVDKLLWKLILWYVDQKDEAAAEKWITVLRNEYPWSKYCDDAMMLLAGKQRTAKNYADAEKLYLDIKLFYDRSDQYGQSLLKLSDMYLEIGEYETAENFLLSVENQFDELAEGGALYQNLALSQYLQKKYLEAARTVDRFSQRLPESSELARSKLLQGSIYATNLNQPDVGKDIFAGLFSDESLDEAIRNEAKEKYDQLNFTGDIDALGELAMKQPEDPLLQKLMLENGWTVGAQLPFRFLEFAEQLIADKELDPALQITAAVIREYPVLGVRDRALFLAAQAYLLQENYSAEHEMLLTLLDEFPGSKHRLTAQHQLAINYLQMRNQRDALSTYESLLSEADESFPEYETAQKQYHDLLQKALISIRGNILNVDPKDIGTVNISVHELPSDSVVTVAMASDGGDYSVGLSLRKRYTLIATAPGYLLFTADLDFREQLSADTVAQDIALISIEKGSRIPLQNIGFDLNSSTLDGESLPTLRAMVRFLKDNPDIEVEIAGHTDNLGDPNFNKMLSVNRALSVARYLLENGISLKNVTTNGYADTDPIAGNDTQEGRAINRRVELRVMK